jgi:hypothetical protein
MLEFITASTLQSFGYTEDGEEFIGEVFFIQAEDSNGNRWSHDYTFPGVKVGYDSEYGVKWFEDVRDVAKKEAQSLLDRIKASGIDSVDGRPHWFLDSPAYGSIAYQEYGQYNDWMNERIAG